MVAGETIAVMDFINELWQFLFAVVNNWAGYATGGFIVATLWFWSVWKQQTLPRRLSLFTALLFLCLAVFNAWRTQLHEKNEALSKLDSTKPKFSLQIRQAVSGTAENTGFPFVLATIALTNAPTGAPSIADNWRIEAKLSNGQEIRGRVLQFSEKTQMNSQDQNFHMRATFDPIYSKAIPQPLVPGARVVGDVMADFPERPELKGSQILISCTDVLGTRIYTTTEGATSNLKEWQGYPGMSNAPFKPQ
jgi:hypothetical protein